MQKKLTEEQEHLVRVYSEEGRTVTSIAQEFGVSRRTINRVMRKPTKKQESKSVSPVKTVSAKKIRRVLHERQKKGIVVLYTQLDWTFESLSLFYGVSTQTIKNILRERGAL